MIEIPYTDVAEIKAACGGEFGPFGPQITVTQEKIDAFAELTGDRQWIHTDVERAKKESPFGGTVAHGFLVLALVPVLIVGSDVTITGSHGALNYGADKLRFVSPVPAGSAVHAKGRLLDAQPKGAGALVKMEVIVYVVGSDKPAMIYEMLILYM